VYKKLYDGRQFSSLIKISDEKLIDSTDDVIRQIIINLNNDNKTESNVEDDSTFYYQPLELSYVSQSLAGGVGVSSTKNVCITAIFNHIHNMILVFI
jgi:hypothetical protein